jgi:hypothetical protein
MHKTMMFTRILAGSIRNQLRETRRSSRARTTAAISLIALTAAISLPTAVLVMPSKIMADNDRVRTFTVDVALGLPYYQNNVKPAKAPEEFFSGDTFIQDGSIFRAGTIPTGKTDFDPNAPGAIGQYRARGTFTTDLPNFVLAAAHDKSAAPDMAFASEMFKLASDKSLILTDGTWPNAYFSATRVVLGGTGSFRDVVGEVHEENIGENKYGFCNFRVTFKIQNVK